MDERRIEGTDKAGSMRYLVVFGLTMGGGSLSVLMGKAEGIRFILATIGIMATMSVGVLS